MSGAIVYLSGRAYVFSFIRREPMAKLQLSDKDKSDLQASYENFFGRNSNHYSEKSKALSRKVYVYGFIIAALVLALAFVPKLLVENITPIV